MVIRDLHLIGIAAPPDEAHAKLVIDSNAVLACAVTVKYLKPVPWRNPQILQPSR